ncbi:biotin carboxylase N-terminal domain-containing protein [Corynebacterium striatum]|uniref:acetyl/propionyl/methylcrotonyl-CoA carboxylase subunit alpha n=1 Tax=Corynebacterium striatum TaxID=43770 RepID=UPI001A34F612|nr:biotin carboxylase N-terminal domain-containing protein [Corynebacterium striatum]MDC7105388.1 biotin carboxylase N-terminal domain-containing protein [Corynebacterium striatum]HAT1212161.1 ATP-grasp domain-containing protein [Corynebacterium striatum]HAT1475509.1 ATP-grasp domain-containing protein [Corynebacterium striatum]HAT6524395.1 ATP-grasp domain-containing protein [Corynebacterium striatum]HAT6562527.1 ATP-grasp domain-containing protein [Corynebacterium striatum]
MISAVLIANRGEIAVRIARAARDLGIRSIAIYSEADAGALHTRVADEAYALPGNTAADTYMNVPALLDIAVRAGADAIHPGYGFLSENADFARAVASAGLTWIGPTPESIELLGDKIAARRVAEEVGAPLAPGTSDPIDDWQEARAFAEEHGLPIAIKAAYGGGGRGLKVVENLEDIEAAFNSAGREAKEAFGRAECYVEKFLTHPRHVEAQILADTHGNVAVLGTRDCSTQRRFQKLIEEAPAPALSDEQRTGIHEGARAICAKVGYTGAGTVEYIVSEDGTISFLEVNTRVQVEHPVTEVVTGVDIIAEQFRIASGEPLSFVDESLDPEPHGHAFEFRINAEDILNGFAPCPGTIVRFEPPTGPGIRVDAGVRSGSIVPPYYDSLIAKLLVWGPTREVALARAKQALAEFDIEGVRTVLPFHRDMVSSQVLADHGDAKAAAGIYTDWLDHNYRPSAESTSNIAPVEAIYAKRTQVAIEIDGKLVSVGLPENLFAADPAAAGGVKVASPSAGSQEGEVTAPYDANLVAWNVADGDTVEEGEAIATIEAMKMESSVKAPRGGTIKLLAKEGDRLDPSKVIATID